MTLSIKHRPFPLVGFVLDRMSFEWASPYKKAAGIYPYAGKLPTDICPPLFALLIAYVDIIPQFPIISYA